MIVNQWIYVLSRDEIGEAVSQYILAHNNLPLGIYTAVGTIRNDGSMQIEMHLNEENSDEYAELLEENL